MVEANRTEIPLSKSKLIKLLVFGIVFLLVGTWLIIKQPQISNPFFNNTIIKNLVAYGGALIGLLAIFYTTKKLLNNKPGLIIDEEGLTENMSVFSFGLIPWSDITEIYESSVQASIASKQKFITIVVKDPGKYVSRETNSIKKKLLSLNEKNYGSPIHISTNTLKIDHDELLLLLTREFAKYGSSERLQ
jgi:hypothetical protein